MHQIRSFVSASRLSVSNVHKIPVSFSCASDCGFIFNRPPFSKTLQPQIRAQIFQARVAQQDRDRFASAGCIQQLDGRGDICP